MLVSKPEGLAPMAADEAATPFPLPPAISIAWLSVAAMFCCTSMAVPLVHLIPLLLDRGESVAVSGSLMFVAMLAASAGRILIGMLCDRIGALGGYMLAVSLQSITVYWFVPLYSHMALYLLAATFGFGFGGVMTARSQTLYQRPLPGNARFRLRDMAAGALERCFGRDHHG